MSLLVNWLESLHEEMKVTTKCSRERNRKSSCRYCIDHCRQQAITIKEHLPAIDPHACTMCGECMIACPLSAIDGLAGNRVFDKGRLVNDSSYTPSVKELLIYKKRGMTSVQIGDFPLNSEWEGVLDETNKQLKLLQENPIEIEKKTNDEILSRREFFTSFQKQGKQLAKSMAPAAWKIERNGWKLTNYFPDFQFYSVEIEKDKCTLCQACFSLCTENVFIIEDQTFRIEHAKCVNCTNCTDVCTENAVRISPEIMAKNESAEDVYLKDCQDCGHNFFTFHKETMKCSICINRDPEWLSPY